MEFIRKRLSENVVNTRDVYLKEEGESLLVAGWVIARQHPRVPKELYLSLLKTNSQTYN
ncbi:MAG: hypothetical protein CM1200mP3_00890 [Chloroflexota bacterium]|nr:MAG: hypothetical protein CM1200mP3_00890 [Chloroflexota bacterium]